MSGCSLTFHVEMKASEAKEENRSSPTASISRGVSTFPFYFDFAELSNPQRDTRTRHDR